MSEKVTDLLRLARPVFLKDLEETSNVQAGFRKDFCLEQLPAAAAVRITARSIYRLYINGVFECEKKVTFTDD